MGSFCGFLYSLNSIGGDSEDGLSKSCRAGLSSNLPTVAGSLLRRAFGEDGPALLFWSFIDGCAAAFWEELVLFL